MAATSTASLLLGLLGCGIYGYSLYYMSFDPTSEVHKLADFMPEKLRIYGQLKFLTYQCLLIQILNSVLHVLAHFIGPLRKPRDIVFTALAYPVGSIVVYSFWLVWFGMGRDLIFPAKLDGLYPIWLNHCTHTVMAPLNILLCLVVHHRYTRYNVMLNLAYMLFYTALLYHIKFKTGHFVYLFLDALNDTQRIVYFVSSGLFSYVLFKSGQLLSSCAAKGDQHHHQSSPSKSGAKKQKQK